MTIGDLILELQEYPDDMEVVGCSDGEVSQGMIHLTQVCMRPWRPNDDDNPIFAELVVSN